jgi:hypothetical protein
LLSILIVIFGFMAVTFSLAGCSADNASEADQSVTEPVEREPAAIEVAQVAQATETPAALAPTAEPSEPDTCSDCHTDKDRLIAVADPEEEVISENEGEG